MAVITPLASAPPTDLTVLGRNWMLNPDNEALRTAVKSIEFELAERERRESITETNKKISNARFAEVAEYLESQMADAPYDHAKDGL